MNYSFYQYIMTVLQKCILKYILPDIIVDKLAFFFKKQKPWFVYFFMFFYFKLFYSLMF